MRLSIPIGLPLKRVLPRGLLGRSLLIVLVPLVVLLGVASTVFYGGHLELISRRLSGAVAGDIAETADLLERYPGPADRAWVLRHAWLTYEIPMRVGGDRRAAAGHAREPARPHGRRPRPGLARQGWPAVRDGLDERSPLRARPRAALRRRPGSRGAAQAPLRSALYIFLLWLLGTAALLFALAALFLRNQVRAISRLAERGRRVRQGARPRPGQAGGRGRGAAGGRRLQPDARAPAALRPAAHGDAGRRQPRPPHAADPPAPGARDAARRPGAAGRDRGDDGRRGRDGAHGGRLPRLRPRRGRGAGAGGGPGGAAAGGGGRGAADRGGRGARQPRTC